MSLTQTTDSGKKYLTEILKELYLKSSEPEVGTKPAGKLLLLFP